ncbi:MAG TPA: UDP-N-acetylmuramyl pentapeptide phosphotransferase, partial [Alphaproteobacteria bacterium]|nr:UDP-N-acetylmuramyl pentapeptide phosphotransferase [Alphaproteobacteria bacterium]
VAALSPLLAFPAALLLGVLLLGGVLGFLVWNRHPAKLFMGDVGSIPLGYLLGYLLLLMAVAGFGGIALVLPLYYLADATYTLLKRLAQRKKFWQAHREHFYQQAVLKTGWHGKVLYPIIGANALLLVTCVLSLKFGVYTLAAAPLIVGGLMWYLKRLSK